MLFFPFRRASHRPQLLLLRQASLLMILMSLLRLFYLLRNHGYFASEHIEDIAWAFFTGLRFDLSILALLLGPLVIFISLPWKQSFLASQAVRRFSQLWLTLTILLLILPSVLDAEVFHFIGRHLTMSLIRNSSDATSVGLPLLFDYWPIVLPTLIACGLVIIVCVRIGENPLLQNTSVSRRSLLRSLATTLLLTLSLGVAIRGGAQGRPLRSQHAITFNHSSKTALLAVNSTHALLTSFDARVLQPIHWYGKQSDLYTQLQVEQIFTQKQPEFDNVVVLILESVGKEFLSSDSDPNSHIPFIESLGEQGLLFENAYSNGAISMMAINSIHGSLPPMNLGALAYSGYSDTRVNGLPAILKKYGYQSMFFHGGPKGVFYFDSMALHAGFDRYLGKDDFKGKAQLTTYWGIDDDSYLQFMAQELQHAKEPFVASAFTLSNHFPYAVPDSYDRQGVKPGEKGKYIGARFTDRAVKNFFATVKDYPWFKRTLFIITGDHPPHERDPHWDKTLPVYQMVPLVFYHPGKKLGEGRSQRITQHADVLPSVLDFLGVGEAEKNSITPFGHSVFQTAIPGRALIGFENNDYFLVSGETVTHYNQTTGLTRQLPLGSDLVHLAPKAGAVPDADRDFLIRGSIQYFTNGIIHDDLYPLTKNQK